MSKKQFTLDTDIFNIVIVDIKLTDKTIKVIPKLNDYKSFIKPKFIDKLNTNNYNVNSQRTHPALPAPTTI